ncbi:hypothetical protein DH2020_005082 [Rehmannia glutinosa]|uniref:Pentatricopeptide repeat-containing protein n=1 Tax=Rehmannia glutinosa TaxID=99300 RepID=A0ABR0XRK0_REHGL
MPSHKLPRGISFYEIEKCIPVKWRQSIKQQSECQKKSKPQSHFACEIIDGFDKNTENCMVDCLLATLKEFASRGHLSKAFRTFSIIQDHALASGSGDFVADSLSSLLLSCTKLKLFAEGKQLHAQVITWGLHKNHLLVPKLVSYYTTFDSPDDAHFVAVDSNILHPLPWNILISSYVYKGRFEEAIFVYKQMCQKKIKPDHFTYPSVLKACAEQSNLDFGREVHKSINASSLKWDLFVQNALISMGMWDEAFELFESMRAAGVEANIIIWNTIAGGCLRTNNFEGALELISQIRVGGSHLDPVAVIIGLNACSHIRALKLGKEIHALAIRNSSIDYDNVKNALITLYSRCGDLTHAYTGFFPFVLVANLRHGKEFHCYIAKREQFKGYLLLWNALIDMYARSGRVLVARRLFDLLDNRDTVTYTSIIAGYGIQGYGIVAVELFEEMIRSHLKPDHVAMVAILSACSHSGLVAQGESFFAKMLSFYGVTPKLEHFACMVDLYGRAGFLKKAKEIILRMPYKPTSEMWATLIGACRIHGNTEIGEWAAEQLLEMKPQNSGYYVLIANMYAAAGCWSKLAKVRTYMRDLGVRKDPGCASVDIGDGFSPFLVEDTSNSQSDEIFVLLGGLTKQMKDIDYVARENPDSEEETFLDCCAGQMDEDFEMCRSRGRGFWFVERAYLKKSSTLWRIMGRKHQYFGVKQQHKRTSRMKAFEMEGVCCSEIQRGGAEDLE